MDLFELKVVHWSGIYLRAHVLYEKNRRSLHSLNS